ncbi:PhzF family phenazine biosynthesis protein [Marinactinospora thermotolerans]|uniref:Phenazine biosynthesis protein PhzF family n=1 Tax=Marinactinospora thermotolerans DSM 45154 TaxID=1122192 RepID=A0A1T4T2R2_9ACTN|nr:PhzF family phenazine biosynthesis protein [Marinactinospora thermotolerans]SKA34722.1 phenazine biosynthesis protein PhzF family [Marinactinospora thermotolerans DSM 45154]
MPRFRVVDAFTDQPFGGNPAAVLVLDEPYEDSWAQRVAAEFNLSETAFLRPLDGDGADYELRWFTPRTEVALCGHATLASAHALLEDGVSGPIRFATRHSGTLTVTHRDGRLWMDFPVNPAEAVAEPEGLADALGVRPLRVSSGRTDDIVVEVADEQTVRGLTPDLTALRAMPCRGVTVTALADPDRPYAFVSRFFAPRVGVPEDPVTGSAHTVLAPYWAERIGRTSFDAFQCSARGGLLSIELPAGAPDRVHIGGGAVTVSEGELRV